MVKVLARTEEKLGNVKLSVEDWEFVREELYWIAEWIRDRRLEPKCGE